MNTHRVRKMRSESSEKKRSDDARHRSMDRRDRSRYTAYMPAARVDSLYALNTPKIVKGI